MGKTTSRLSTTPTRTRRQTTHHQRMITTKIPLTPLHSNNTQAQPATTSNTNTRTNNNFTPPTAQSAPSPPSPLPRPPLAPSTPRARRLRTTPTRTGFQVAARRPVRQCLYRPHHLCRPYRRVPRLQHRCRTAIARAGRRSSGSILSISRIRRRRLLS